MMYTKVQPYLFVLLTRALEGANSAPHLFFANNFKTAARSAIKFWHTCGQFKNSPCVQIFTS